MKKIIIPFISLFVYQFVSAQNVGIGTNAPAFKLDVQGRMRVKTGTLGNIGTSSGIWMEDYRDGTNRIFFGMQDSIRAGFYGSGPGGAGWEFNFNAKTGAVGIGRNASNYRLELDDINGAGIGLYNNGSFGGSIIVNDVSMEISPKNGSTACFPLPCAAADLILIPSVSGMGTTTAGNVGIGVNTPSQKLSLNGAMGLYYESTFIGSFGRSGTDLLINARSGSTINSVLPADLILQTYTTANTTSGNVGIGTITPDSKLDVYSSSDAIHGISNTGIGVFASSNTGNALEVDGNIKITGNGQIPAQGKVLTSDANGVASWQGAIAFAAHSLPGNTLFVQVPPQTYFKIPFGFEEYDLSNNYTYTAQSPQHTFIAPVAGIYHFDTKIFFNSMLDDPFVALVLVRNGASSTLARIEVQGEDNEQNNFAISRDVKLQAGDQVFVEAYHNSSSTRTIFSEYRNNWFSGRLVIKL